MCFGHSGSEEEGEQVTSRGKVPKPMLKRRRSPAETDKIEPQDPRKLSKLDSTASTLAQNQQMFTQKPLDSQEALEPTLPAFNDADNDPPQIEELQSARLPQKRTSLSSERTFPIPGIANDTPLDQRTAIIEAHNAPEELYPYTFQQFISLRFYSALHFEFKRSTKMNNSELAACFDLISKTSQQDYKSSSRGWDPDYKMEEMSDKEMMYLLVRQAEGYVGVDKDDEQDSSEKHAGAILGFLSFKFEPEDEELKKMRPVQYIYEIHLDDRLRGQSLGGRMINWAESQARLASISKMMLTVFTVNETARRLYEREGFAKDESSPEDRVTRRKVIKADYIIMSKEL
jgi:ribosomal protein S18 acetylase RimI-like enzyme